MAIQQSAALLQLIAFVNEIRNDNEVMQFIMDVRDVDAVYRSSNLVPAKPMLQLLGQVLEVGDTAYDDAAPNGCTKLSIEKLQSVIRRADEISVSAAVMTNMGGALMVNPVALAMLAQQGIDVVIVHDSMNYLEEQDTYTPSVYFVTEHFVL